VSSAGMHALPTTAAILHVLALYIPHVYTHCSLSALKVGVVLQKLRMRMLEHGIHFSVWAAAEKNTQQQLKLLKNASGYQAQ
jgi:hypothetical protein